MEWTPFKELYAALVIDWVFVLIAREWDCTSSSSLVHSYYQRHLKVISGISQAIFQTKYKWVLQFEIPKVLLWQILYQMTVITFLLPKAELCVACLDQDSLYFANLFLALCFLRTGCIFWSRSELRVPFDWTGCTVGDLEVLEVTWTLLVIAASGFTWMDILCSVFLEV